MQNAGSRNPTAEERIESIPSYLSALPSIQGTPPRLAPGECAAHGAGRFGHLCPVLL
jgi:hypothetical protein